MKKNKEIKDYWVCERCEINSLDTGGSMIPCPRGSCDAECKGEIHITTELILTKVIKIISEDEFYETYKLVDNHIDNNSAFDGKMFETYGEEIKFVWAMAKQNRVISIIDGDDDDNAFAYYTSGYHKVNVMGYFVTSEPIKEEFEVKLEND